MAHIVTHDAPMNSTHLTVRVPHELALELAARVLAESERTGLPVTPSALVRRALLRELRGTRYEAQPGRIDNPTPAA